MCKTNIFTIKIGKSKLGTETPRAENHIQWSNLAPDTVRSSGMEKRDEQTLQQSQNH
jgi:hypothetical protein